jgi:hypothetical protein
MFWLADLLSTSTKNWKFHDGKVLFAVFRVQEQEGVHCIMSIFYQMMYQLFTILFICRYGLQQSNQLTIDFVTGNFNTQIVR